MLSLDIASYESFKKDGCLKPKPRIKRDCGFTVAEDVTVAKARVAVNKQAIVGAEQKEDVFYNSIHEIYSTMNKSAVASARQFESTKKRTKQVWKACTAFAAERQ